MKKPDLISEFQCQERLYLYATNRLPEQQKQEVEAALKIYPDCNKKLKQIQDTFHYCLQLRRVLPDPKLINEMQERRSFWRELGLIMSLSHWKEPVQIWTKALVILFFIVLFAFVVPWQQMKPSQWIDIAFFEQQIRRSNPLSPAEEEQLSDHEEISFEGKNSGLRLLRVFVKSSQIDEDSVAINQLITTLGAAKVDSTVMWQRQKDGSSFHFYLDQKSHAGLLEQIKNFGPVRIYQEENGREMPDGKIRIIMWVNDTELSN